MSRLINNMVSDRFTDWRAPMPIPAFLAVLAAFFDTGIGIGLTLVALVPTCLKCIAGIKFRIRHILQK